MNKRAITDLLENQNKLEDVEQKVVLYNEFLQGQQIKKQQLEREINLLRTKRDNYDSMPPL